MEILAKLWTSESVPNAAKTMFTVLWLMLGKPGTIEGMSIHRLAMMCGISEGKVRDRLKSLEKYGLINLEKTSRGAFTLYVYQPVATQIDRPHKPTPLLDFAEKQAEFQREKSSEKPMGIPKEKPAEKQPVLQSVISRAIPPVSRPVIRQKSETKPVSEKSSEKPREIPREIPPVKEPVPNIESTPKKTPQNSDLKQEFYQKFHDECVKLREEYSRPVIRKKSETKPASEKSTPYTNTIVRSCLKPIEQLPETVGDALGSKVVPSESEGKSYVANRASRKASIARSIREHVITRETDPKSEYLCFMVAEMAIDGKFDGATMKWNEMKKYALEQAKNRGGAIQRLLNITFGEQEVTEYRKKAVAEWHEKSGHNHSHKRNNHDFVKMR